MKIRLRGEIISKKAMLDNPEAYRDRTIMCFEIKQPAKIREYCEIANFKKQTLMLTNWSSEPAKRQVQLFFELRDRLAEHWCAGRPVTRKEKDEVYRSIIGMLEQVDGSMDEVESISGLDAAELSGAIDMLKDWLYSEGVDLSDLQSL